MKKVALCPRIDLHKGYHGSLVSNDSFEYRLHDPDHLFLCDSGFESPFVDMHAAEFLVCAQDMGEWIIQSARIPVLDTKHWLIDTDDLLLAPLCGRNYLDEEFRDRFSHWSNLCFKRKVKARVSVMLAALAHPSCAGVLLRGLLEESIASARSWFAELDLANVGERYIEKVISVYPAVKPISAEDIRRKWANTDPLRILFCGNDFHTKNGLLALQVMDALASRYRRLEFTYIGELPDGVLDKFPRLRYRLHALTRVPHASVLAEMEKSHVFFHPSRFESIGMSLLEATSRGLAIVVGAGTGMEHTRTLFADGGALLVDSSIDDGNADFYAYTDALVSLLEQPASATSMGLSNHAKASSGPYSFEAQSHKLEGVYERAAAYDGYPLRLEELPFSESLTVVRRDARVVVADFAHMLSASPGSKTRFLLGSAAVVPK